MRRLRMHDAAFKAKVAFEAAKGEKTTEEIAAIYEVHLHQVSAWRNELLERLPEIFNTDQGSQFTGSDFTGILEEAGVTIIFDMRTPQ